MAGEEGLLFVGRTGARSVLLPEEERVGRGGHSCGPQRRSVRQHPPPRLEGQDWKPVEQGTVVT